jgi:hypothetical protein
VRTEVLQNRASVQRSQEETLRARTEVSELQAALQLTLTLTLTPTPTLP